MTNLPETTEKKWQITPLHSLPLRNRLVRGSITIVFLAIAIMGIFVYLQTRRTNTFLTERLETSILEDARNILDSTADQQADTLTNYFISLETSILSLREYSQNLFRNQPSFQTGTYWDAADSLSRNDKRSWDNPNSEIGSVFIPASSNLPNSMISEINSMRHMDLVAPSILEANPDIIAVYFGGASGYTLYYPNIDLAAIVPEDFDVTGRPWYLDASQDQNPDKNAVWSDPYLDAALNGIVITNSAPVYNNSGRLRGVVAQDIQLTKITEIVTNIRVGETGYAFLVDQDKRLIALPESGYSDLGIDPEATPLGNELTSEDLSGTNTELNDVVLKMISGESGFSQILVNDTERFIVYRTIPGVDFSLAIIVPAQEMLLKSLEARQQVQRENVNALVISIFVILGIFVLTLFVTINFSNNLTEPLISLTKTAEDMAKGNLNARANIAEQNEIGTLATTLNSMAAELKESIDTLELRVAERTAEVQKRSQELASVNTQIQRRAAQFEALAQVSQSITSIRDLQELLSRVATVVSENFGFYHVGLFLLDQANEYAVLSATNSEGGKKMIQRKHRLRVGAEGIVGNVSATGEPRIALDVGKDAVFFNNPELPDTHSEMALPLRGSGRIVGALDVQSTEIGAFTEQDVQTLSLLAEQVSLAIENARLFDESRRALAESEMVSRQTTREAWRRLPEQHKLLGYRYSVSGAAPLREPVSVEQFPDGQKGDQAEAGSIVVPIELRGEVIGTLLVQSPSAKLSDDQRDLVRAVAERVALSAENARLFEETTMRAERERKVSDITSKIRSHNDPQAMIETAINELRIALKATKVEIIPQAIKGAENKKA